MKTSYNLSLSGGGDKIPFHHGAVSKIVSKLGFPKNVCGVSSGAIQAYLMCTVPLHTADHIAKSLSVKKHIYGINPFGFKGVSIAIKNVLQGKPYFWDYYKLEKTIKSLITEEDHVKFTRHSGINCYVGVVCYETGELKYIKLNNLDYETAIQYVLASCKIPLFSAPQHIDLKHYYDGGLRSHIGSSFVAQKIMDGSPLISVLTRTKDLEKESLQSRKTFNIKNVLSVVSRVFKILMYDNSVDDIEKADVICRKKAIRHLKIYPGFNLLPSLFSTNTARNKRMIKHGSLQAEKELTKL